jgi:hypothetical protein
MKKVIATGKKTSEELMNMCDVFLMNNRITSDQYNEMAALISQ